MEGGSKGRFYLINSNMRQMQSILLINPDWTGIHKQKQFQFKRIWPPLDLAIAGAMLEQAGHHVRILDNNVTRLSPEKIGRLSKSFDRVFVTSSPYDRWQCPSLNIAYFFDTLRHIQPDRLYIMGAHVTERPKTILSAGKARAAILGEPERAIFDIVQKDHAADFPDDIPGTAYFRKSLFVQNLLPRHPAVMDDLPFPAFHLLPMDRYYYEFMGNRFTILEGSRGCPFQCHFCYLGMFGSRFRQKSLERFLDEIIHAVKRFQLKNIYFMDLEFGLNRRFLISLCNELIRLNLGFSWCCQTRVTDLDSQILALMKQAGCTLIHFGIESGSERILHKTGKGIRIPDCIKAVSLAQKAGIRTAVFMNLGFPGETLEEMKATIDLAIKLDPTYASFHLIVPFPGTALAREIGLDPEAFSEMDYPHYNASDHDLALLKSKLRNAYIRFYLRPGYLKHILNHMKHFQWNQIRMLLNQTTR